MAEETVSRWEDNAMPIGLQADRLLRLLVAQGRLSMSYPAENLLQTNPKKTAATRVELEARDEHWELLSA